MQDIDVLLPFHRYDFFLLEAIESIKNQVGICTRIILIDDRPEKKTLTNLNLRRSDIIVESEGGLGYGLALELASPMISAPVVALMNSDDLSVESRLSKQMRLLEASDVAITRLGRITSNGKRVPSLAGSYMGNTFDASFLLIGPHGANASWCVRTDWWKREVFFDSLPALDWRIALSAFPTSAISIVPSEEYLYRRHSKQVTRTSAGGDIFSHVATLWRNEAQNRSLPTLTVESERFVSQPWTIPKTKLNVDEILTWSRLLIGSVDDEKLRHELQRLLKRRFATALGGRSDIKSKFHLAREARSQTFSLAKDVTKLKVTEFIDHLFTK